MGLLVSKLLDRKLRRDEMYKDKGLKLGINGFGRIGKLTLWHISGENILMKLW